MNLPVLLNHRIDGSGFPEPSQFNKMESPCIASMSVGTVFHTGGATHIEKEKINLYFK